MGAAIKIQPKLARKIIPIIVTYNPSEAVLIASLNALLIQSQFIVVVDNHSTQDIAEIVRNFDKENINRIKLIKLQHNDGLGAAFNIGISLARKLNADFVLLMDQDSIPESDMVEKLYQAYCHLKNQGISIGIVAPRYYDSISARLSQFIRVTPFGFARISCDKHDNDYLRADFLISSGSLIALKTLDEVGDMDADLFIDHIDTEWCFRARSKGFELYGACNAIMQHSIGDKRIRFWWGRWRDISFHQSIRYYYMFRNSVLLWKRPYMPVAWKRADQLRILCSLIFFTIFSSNRVENFRMMLRGLKDGFSNRTGTL